MMGISPEESEAQPEFGQLFEEEGTGDQAEPDEVDLSKKAFTPIAETEENPKPFFRDKDYYKKLLLIKHTKT